MLALASTYACRVVLTPLLASRPASSTGLVPMTWTAVFYLRVLLPPLFVGLWSMVLLPRETRTLYTAAATSRLWAPGPQLLLLLLMAAILVSGADLVFQWRGGSAVDMRLHSDIILPNAWALNILILFSAFAFVFAMTSKVLAALVLVSPLYVGLGLATLAKIEYMHSAVQPLDFIRLAEFIPLFRSFFGTGVLVATLVLVGGWIVAVLAIRKAKTTAVPPLRRWSTGAVSLMTLLGLTVILVIAPSKPQLNELFQRIGVPGGQHREMARKHGFLLSFLSELPTVFVSAPHPYSRELVMRTMRRYQTPANSTSSMKPSVNLIIYLVESMMDPHDLGWQYTSEPLPHLRALSKGYISGYAIVPEEFGGSANTEFELLTGMSRTFLPEGSLPYRQYLRRPIPSLPGYLNSLGYTTTAIQADPKYYYNRERVYQLMRFQSKLWLRGSPGIQAGRRGPSPPDSVIVNAIIQASRGQHPFFIFAFPSSTHSPYNIGVYRSSHLDVIGGLSGGAKAEVKEYINALREADQAIGKLIGYFGRQPDSTIVAILGDHLPPLTKPSLQAFFSDLSSLSPADRARRLHRTPLLIWANFDLGHQELELSINGLASFLLEKMRIQPTGFFRLTDAIRRELPIVGPYVQTATGKVWPSDSLPTSERGLLNDYRVMEYDLLLGEQYALQNNRRESQSFHLP
jgi:hypothetical protein